MMRTFSMIFMLVFATLIQAQEKEKKETRTVEQYENVLKTANDWSEKFLKPDFYKEVVFKEKSGDKTKKFSELSEFEQKVFLLFQAEKLTDNLEYLEVEFKKDLEIASKKDDKDKYIIPEKAKEKTDAAGKTDIEGFLKRIRDDRVSVAQQYEKYATSFFTENKTKFNDKEIEEYLQRMKSYHDKQSLIERKK